MTGSYDQGSLVLAEIVPVADLQVGDVITYRPPARLRARRPRHAPDRLDRARTPGGERVFRTQRRRQPGRRPLDLLALAAPTQARARCGIPYAGHALSALGRRDVRLAVIALPALLIALFSARPPVARARRGGAPARARGGDGVSRVALAMLALLAWPPRPA